MTVMAQLQEVFREVFDDDRLVLRPELTANDVDGWDSLSHVNLIVAVEARFGIRFAQKELMTQKDVGDLARGVAAKTGLPLGP